MLRVYSTRPVPFNRQALDEFVQGYVSRGLQLFFRETRHPHPRSGKLRIELHALQAILDLCKRFQEQHAADFQKLYQLERSPWSLGESFWDKHLYDMDDNALRMDWVVASWQFPNPKFILNGDVLSIASV